MNHAAYAKNLGLGLVVIVLKLKNNVSHAQAANFLGCLNM